MLYSITQQAITSKPDTEPYTRQIQIDLPDHIHAIAIELQIAIVIEIGQDLISLEATFGNRRLTKITQLELPGFAMGPYQYPGPQQACIALIEEAHDATK